MDEKRRTWVVVALSLVVAGAVRLLYASWAVTDFWGDAYHHWLISRLTLSNGWTYTDYKGLESVWLPGYHYLVSAAMAAWRRFDLAPAHLANLVLGTLACGLVARLVTDVTHDWRAGLGAGLVLALVPWHIAYSFINMPEVLAGVLLLFSLLAARRGHAGWLTGLAFVSALTRHELTLLLAPVAFWLGWRHQWRAMLGVVTGTAMGLGLWSGWSWYVTGEPLAWWTRYRAATAWDAHFWTAAGVRLTNLATLAKTALRAFPPLGIVGPVVAASILHRRWRCRMPIEGWLLMALVGVHWLALGLGFVAGHLPAADPRYVLVSLPVLVGVGVVAIAAAPHRNTRVALAGLHTLFLILALIRQLSTFPGKAYVIAPERAVGEYLGAVAPDEGFFWVDAPVSIYYSRLQPERFFSSNRLLPAEGENEVRWTDGAPRTALSAIAAHDIRFVVWEDVPYAFVQHVWPQMAHGQPFEQDGYHFEPVFRYSGWELDYGARPTMLWRVELVADQR